MTVPAELDQPDIRPLEILEALGSAWTAYSLYPDPSGQPAFIRALDVIGSPFDSPVVVFVGPGKFLDGEEEIAVKREGVERLARELFLHDVEALRIRGGVGAADLISFFEVVGRDDEEVRQEGGISAAVAEIDPSGLEVFERGLLQLASMEDLDEDGILEAMRQDSEGLSPPAAAANRGAEPAEVAALVQHHAGSGDARDGAESRIEDPVVALFLDGLAELHGHAVPYAESARSVAGALREGASDPWKGFRTFLESFFHLDRPSQLMVLEVVLDSTDETPRQLFLDQLSGADLADYFPELSARAREALTAYAVVMGSEGGRPQESLGGLTSSVEVSSARQAVAARISEVLSTATGDRSAAQELLADLRASMSDSPDAFEMGTRVLRGLLECEYRDERFERVLRVWTGRVSRYLRDGDWRRGQHLLSAVLEEPPYAAERDGAVLTALERVAGRETLRLILEREMGAHPSDEAVQLLETMGTASIGPLVDLLSKEEDGQKRRLLTELLANATRPDPRAIEPFLHVQPWFVLRNLATVLGKTGRQAAVPGLRQLVEHDDHRVRVEAARGLVRIQREGAGPILVRLLSDENERVRHTAATLIRATDSEDLDDLLVREIEQHRLPADVAVDAVGILAARTRPGARKIVEELAGKRFAVGAAKAIRDAARQALKGVGR